MHFARIDYVCCKLRDMNYFVWKVKVKCGLPFHLSVFTSQKYCYLLWGIHQESTEGP